MTLREIVDKLLTVKNLPTAERQKLDFVIQMSGNDPLEGMLFPEVEQHIRGRYEWFFLPDGTLRRKG